ncbi:hypothetical protein FHX64_000440 [Microbacter margulisiae]|uniref:Uncharacterized protein n=1 Tax=Microbacter margulisiae TaxID=1350067 RepID=A0A7W5DNW2_9PORP|nr:hypothetical protein [Microbacter margulisiae]
MINSVFSALHQDTKIIPFSKTILIIKSLYLKLYTFEITQKAYKDITIYRYLLLIITYEKMNH